MIDRIVPATADGTRGTVFCAEYPNGFYGPLPPQDPANRAIYDRLVALRVKAEPFVPPVDPPPTVTGNQWIFGLKTLRLSDAWELAVAKSKTSDRQRWSAISRTTVILEGDPLLVRIAGNGGTDGAGKAAIDPAAVFAQARIEPT